MAADTDTSFLIKDANITEQFLDQYTFQSISAVANAARVNLDTLKQHTDEKVIAIDIGADKYLITLIQVSASGPVQISPVSINFLRDGNILETLARIVVQYQSEHATKRIAVSSHGEIINHKYIKHGPPTLVKELETAGFPNDLGGYLQSKAGPDTTFTMYNDAVSGGSFAYFMNHLFKPDTEHLIYFIVGGGVNGCYVDKDGNIAAAEAGHLAWVPFPDDPQAEKCAQAGAPYCVEVYSRGPYLETKLAQKYLGEEVPGREMDRRLEAGDEAIAQVYAHGARNAAHTILGILKAFDLLNKEKLTKTAIVTHGGVPDNVDIYNPLLQQFIMEYLEKTFGSLPRIPITASCELRKNLGDNTGALGAALLAF